MRRTFVATVTAVTVLASVATSAAAPPDGRGAPRPAGAVSIALDPLGTYASTEFDVSAAEIVAHDPETQRLFVVNAQAGVLDVLDVSDPETPVKVDVIDAVAVPGIADTLEDGEGVSINSVDVHDGVVAVAVEAPTKTDDGWAAFFATDGTSLAAVRVGALPDMVTFSPDGNWVLVANEGEPDDDYGSEEGWVDPEGSISVIDVRAGIEQLDQGDVDTAGFTAYDAPGVLDPAVRVFGPEDDAGGEPLPSENLEPEYIVVDDDSATAYAVLQENNAMAVIDIASATVTDIWPFGFKDHSLPGNGLDASDRDGRINIQPWPVLGMYMPDGFDGYRFRGETYLVTANEGDARDYDSYSEEARVKDLGKDGIPGLCTDSFAGFDDLLADENLGRLTITLADGLRSGEECYEELYAFGARSFSIWSTDGELVYDSGDEFERITAERIPADFNANNDENDSFESRSDNKGPEPESVAIGKVAGRTYAFVVLERVGGIMVYDISDPRAAFFVDYVVTRNFEVDAVLGPEAGEREGQTNPDVGDLGPEGIIFIEADDSPTGRPVLVVGSEVSGTTTLLDISTVTPGGGPRR